MPPLFAMDSTGVLMIVFSIVVFASAGIGFWILDKKGPRLAVLVVGFALLIASYAYEPKPIVRRDGAGDFLVSYSRAEMLFDGLLGLVGLFGILMGFIVLLRRRKVARRE